MPRPKSSANGEGTITLVKRSRAKQDDLPGVSVSSRKIAEIEDLADEVVAREDAHKSAKHQLDDAMENLVASMRRHKKSFYNRPTWGTVTLKEPKVRAAVKKGQHGSDDDAEDEAQDAALAQVVKDTLEEAGAEVQLETV